MRAFIILAVACSLVTGSAEGGSTARPDGKAACAAYDIHLFTAIEDAGREQAVDPDALVQAAQALAVARETCAHDVERALKLYETIAHRFDAD